MNGSLPSSLTPATQADLEQAVAEVLATDPVAAEPSSEDALGSISEEGKDLPDTAPRLLSLCGASRCGKDHLAAYIHSSYEAVIRIAYSTPIIAEVNTFLAAEADGAEAHRIVEANKPLPHYRHLLQAWGWGRREQDPEYWINQLEETLDEISRQGARLVIISGARVVSDLTPVRKRDGELWRVECPTNSYSAGHKVEGWADLPADRILTNPGAEVPGAFEAAIEAALLQVGPVSVKLEQSIGEEIKGLQASLNLCRRAGREAFREVLGLRYESASASILHADAEELGLRLKRHATGADLADAWLSRHGYML